MLVQTLPFPSLSPPPPKSEEGSKESWRADTSRTRCVTSAGVCFLHTSFALTTQPAPGREAVGLLPRPVQSCLLTKGFFFLLSFFLNKTSKLFFVSLLLLLSLSLFTLPVQTTNLRRNLKKTKKTHHPGRSGNPFPLVNRLIFSECDHRRRPTGICAHALPAKGRSHAHVG